MFYNKKLSISAAFLVCSINVNAYAIELECRNTDLTHKSFRQVDLEIDGNNSAKLISYNEKGERLHEDCFMRDRSECRPGDKKWELIKIKDDATYLYYRDFNTGVLPIETAYELNKKTGELKISLWKKIVIETKPHETFQFKQEVKKTAYRQTDSFKFICK